MENTGMNLLEIMSQLPKYKKEPTTILMSDQLQQEINKMFIKEYLVECGSDAKYTYFTHRTTKKGYRMQNQEPFATLVEMPNYTNGNSRD